MRDHRGQAAVVAGLLAVGLFIAAPRSATAVDDASIVRIGADLAGGRVSHGSGCFWGSEDLVLTAYHVVQGARSIRIYVRGKDKGTVEVVAIAPGFDLALLRLLDLPPSERGPGLMSGEALGPPFPPDLSLDVRGHPLGWSPVYCLKGDLANTGFISSRSISDDRMRDVFAADIDLVAFTVPAYGGMSGGPVLAGDLVVGVLSGSVNEGGAITWAIPVKYLATEMQPVGKAPRDVVWPPLTLFDPGRYSGLNFSAKKPDDRWALHAGLGGRLEPEGAPDEYGVQVQFLRDDFTRDLSWGVEICAHYYGYDRRYSLLDGIDEESFHVTKYLGFGNLFVVRKHFGSCRRPYYGLSCGLPVNAQIRAGFKLFAGFNLELRGMYFRPEQTTIRFNYYGESVQDEQRTDEFRVMLGLNLELWP